MMNELRGTVGQLTFHCWFVLIYYRHFNIIPPLRLSVHKQAIQSNEAWVKYESSMFGCP